MTLWKSRPGIEHHSRHSLELNGLVHPAALLTTRAVHIGIVGIDITTRFAAENMIVTGSRAKAALAMFGVKHQRSQPQEQDCHITEQDGLWCHTSHCSDDMRLVVS